MQLVILFLFRIESADARSMANENVGKLIYKVSLNFQCFHLSHNANSLP